jgi:hypothetical protein
MRETAVQVVLEPRKILSQQVDYSSSSDYLILILHCNFNLFFFQLHHVRTLIITTSSWTLTTAGRARGNQISALTQQQPQEDDGAAESCANNGTARCHQNDLSQIESLLQQEGSCLPKLHDPQLGTVLSQSDAELAHDHGFRPKKCLGTRIDLEDHHHALQQAIDLLYNYHKFCQATQKNHFLL